MGCPYKTDNGGPNPSTTTIQILWTVSQAKKGAGPLILSSRKQSPDGPLSHVRAPHTKRVTKHIIGKDALLWIRTRVGEARACS
jgi:hypothetical protein